MPRYIDADALISKIAFLRDSKKPYNVVAMSFDAATELIKRIPTVSPDEVRGKGEWIKAHDDTVWWWECSVCHEPPLQRYKCDRLSNFCPSCGAKVEVTSDD